MSDSFVITHGDRATSFIGPDAVELYRAAVLKSALGLLAIGITPTRGLTKTKALAMCKRYTGQTYKRTEIERARKDLSVWIETMKSAIPVRSNA